MKKLIVPNFSLEYTLECGQFFRFKKLKEGYLVNYLDTLFIVQQKGNVLFYSKNVSEEFIRHFFRLDDDLDEIYEKIGTDNFLKNAIKKYNGLRLIRQDPWECTISYICSSASNIPKIQKNIEKLSEFFGEPIVCKEHASYSFPKINSIKEFEKIVDSKTGYRARFIYDVNKRVTEAFFEKLKNMNYADAKKELMSLAGVGEKIADCILLFSLDHLDSFPMDTWIAKGMKEIYGIETKNYKNVREFALKKWGKHAGYAQQYIYMKMREDEKNR